MSSFNTEKLKVTSSGGENDRFYDVKRHVQGIHQYWTHWLWGVSEIKCKSSRSNCFLHWKQLICIPLDVAVKTWSVDQLIVQFQLFGANFAHPIHNFYDIRMTSNTFLKHFRPECLCTKVNGVPKLKVFEFPVHLKWFQVIQGNGLGFFMFWIVFTVQSYFTLYWPNESF